MTCQQVTAAGASAASPPEMSAQRLVIQGYKSCLRRNYLIQLVNDDLTALRVGNGAMDLAVFQQHRLTQWCEHGILPREIFYKLIKETWKDPSLHLATAAIPVAGAFAFTSAQPPAYAVDIGLTFEGFESLGAHTQLTDLFRKKAPAFAQGATLRASRLLGDTGLSAPTHWRERYRKGEMHAVFVVHAPTDSNGDATVGLRAFEVAVLTALGLSNPWWPGDPLLPGGLIQAEWIEQSALLGSPREVHFGYVDGLSTPRFESISDQKLISQEAEINVHCPGELLLGHVKNDKSNPWRVPGAYAQMSMPAPIHPLPARTAYADFFKDGSFGVLRKMEQDVTGFETYLEAQAQLIVGAQNLHYVTAWLKAKMLGRWPNGELVQEAVAATTQNKPLHSKLQKLTQPVLSSTPPSNTFNHHESDPLGMACPFGAHIRRMNPRDDPVVPILRRPLLRRGVPYGQKYNPNKPDTIERGMLGLFFCSSIEQQFEHVLGNWSNNNPMGLPYTQAGKDPLVGNQDCIGNTFEIPLRAGPPLMLKGLPVFVATRGTCYAFFPSITALQKIARGGIVSSSMFLEKI